MASRNRLQTKTKHAAARDDASRLHRPRRLLLPLLLAPVGLLLMGAAEEARSQKTAAGSIQDLFLPTRVTPGGFTRNETPQFILVTFDDGITPFAESLIQPVVGTLRNPDGSKAPITYFVTRPYTVTSLARQRYLEGNELANHTETHNTGFQTTAADWWWNLTEMNRYLVDTVGMASNQIAGFRAPDLEMNDAAWADLKTLEFTYDASLTETVENPPDISTGLDSLVWPHTLDQGSGTSCTSGGCPDSLLPGLWSIPLWEFYDSLWNVWGAMDPAAGYDSVFQDILNYDFQMRYNGNRCPFGLFMHAGQLGIESRRKILTAFLVEKLKLPDVWMITMRGLIEWLRNPVPVSRLSAWFASGGYRGVGRMPAAAPRSLFLTAPLDGAAAPGSAARLQWEVQLTAETYQLQVATTSGFTARTLDTAGLAGVSFQLAGLAAPGKYYWRVRGVNALGAGVWSETRGFSLTGTTGVAEAPGVPATLALDQNFPNPFNPSTTIRCQFPAAGKARLAVYDLLGREVAVLIDGIVPAGTRSVQWNAGGLPSGVYLCRLEFGGNSHSLTRKILFVK